MSSVNAIDYFATLGKPKGDLVLKELPSLWDEDEVCAAREVYNDAITDIAVVFPGFHCFYQNATILRA